MNDFKDLFERIKEEHYAKHSKESEILNLNLSYGRKKEGRRSKNKNKLINIFYIFL